MLSDINFTSMVPELSRSADHICPDGEITESDAESKTNDYYKGHLLQTPDYTGKGWEISAFKMKIIDLRKLS